ncbi:MAG: hypothetical protein WBE75_05030 [Candidatus Omnitrophota bacterium]|jgi:hypothetical protein
MQETDPAAGYRSNEYYEHLYGKGAVITRLGKITIVHLDHPDKAEIERRKEKVIRGEITGEGLDDDCPLCRELKDKPHDVVYYGQD